MAKGDRRKGIGDRKEEQEAFVVEDSLPHAPLQPDTHTIQPDRMIIVAEHGSKSCRHLQGSRESQSVIEMVFVT